MSEVTKKPDAAPRGPSSYVSTSLHSLHKSVHIFYTKFSFKIYLWNKLSASITLFTPIILTKSREILLPKERVIFTSKMLQPSRCNCPTGAGIKVCPTLYIALHSYVVKAVWKVNFIIASVYKGYLTLTYIVYRSTF